MQNYRLACTDVVAMVTRVTVECFAPSSQFDHLETETLNVLSPRALLGTDIRLPHVCLGDEACPLKT